MEDEIKVIEKMLPLMDHIIDAVPGERFTFKDSEMLVILERRMKECDFKDALKDYCEIFAKNDRVEISDIKRSAVALVKIKALVAAEKETYDAKLYRNLIKDYRTQTTKVSNIIRLTKVNVMTASEYEKEQIRDVLFKNEELMSAFMTEIELLEKQIERIPQMEEQEDDIKPEEKVEEEVKPKRSLISGIKNVIGEKKEKKEIEERLRGEEKQKSRMSCVEIPFYDKSLVYTELFKCKDIPEFVILKRKNNIYFGFADHVKNKAYDNSDQSLIELTEASDEMIQFVTVNLLNEDYVMHPLCSNEKRSMQMYFNFISGCFERYIGTKLTVMEYLNFKDYYNKLVLKMFELEDLSKHSYYKALELADRYVDYMEIYDLDVSGDKEGIINDIISENVDSYIEDLRLIMSHHMVDLSAKREVEELISRMDKFYEYLTKSEAKIVEEEEISGKMDPTPESKDPAIEFKACDYNDNIPVTADDVNRVQIKVQVLNKDKVIVDEGIFSCANVKTAVADYLGRKGFIKKIGIVLSGKEVFLFSSKNGSLSVPVLDKEMRKQKRLNQGLQGELTDFYEERIRKTMIEITGGNEDE